MTPPVYLNSYFFLLVLVLIQKLGQRRQSGVHFLFTSAAPLVEIDAAAVMIFLALIALLAVAAIRKLPGPGLFAAAALSLIIGIMVWTAPGFSDPPDLTDAGILDIAFSFTAAAMMLTHVVLLIIYRQR